MVISILAIIMRRTKVKNNKSVCGKEVVLGEGLMVLGHNWWCAWYLKFDWNIPGFFWNACTKSGPLRFSQFSAYWLICLLTYEFWLSLWKIARCSVILLLPLFIITFNLHLYYLFWNQTNTQSSCNECCILPTLDINSFITHRVLFSYFAYFNQKLYLSSECLQKWSN